MGWFIITINGTPDRGTADNFWRKIKAYNVNFLVLDKHCYIYGQADEWTVDRLYNKATELGFELELERG